MATDRPQLQRLNPGTWALMLFTINLVLGLIFTFLVFPRLGGVTSGLDPDGYGAAGHAWYQSSQFTSVSRAPLYPGFIALASLLTGGYRVSTIQVAQCVLLASTGVLMYAIFRRTLDKDELVARAASLICAVYPMFLWYVPRLWTETFLTFTLALFTLTLVRLLQKPTATSAVACGLTAGMAALSKGIALVFIPMTILILLLYFRKSALRWLALFCCAGLTLIAPWTLRNWRITGTALPIHTGGGFNFYLGNGFTRHWLQAPCSYVTLHALTVQDIEDLYTELGFQPDNPIQRDEILLSSALLEIKKDFTLLLRKIAIQSLTFWYLAADFPKSVLTGVLEIPIALLAIPGIARAIQRRSWAVSLLIPVIGIMGVSVLVFSFARLSATVMPYLLGLLVYGWLPMIPLRPRLKT